MGFNTNKSVNQSYNQTENNTATAANSIASNAAYSNDNNQSYNQADNHKKRANQFNNMADIAQNIQNQAATHCANNSFLEKLNYPAALDKNTCEALAGLLLKAQDQAQNILDLLALRLENTQNPIKDVVVYCASLVRKANSNKLELDALNAHRARKKAAPSAAEQEMQALHEEYQDANSDYQHFKRVHAGLAHSNGCSVEEYLQQKGLEDFWNNIVERLAQVKAAIDALVRQ